MPEIKRSSRTATTETRSYSRAELLELLGLSGMDDGRLELWFDSETWLLTVQIKTTTEEPEHEVIQDRRTCGCLNIAGTGMCGVCENAGCAQGEVCRIRAPQAWVHPWRMAQMTSRMAG